MMKNKAFDNDKYVREQKEAILDRMKSFDARNARLYLEFGGKLLFDYHAARVLPGYDPNVKMKLLRELSGQADIILCIYAGDIERKKLRADFGITYDADAMKLIDDLRDWGVGVRAVVITRYENQPAARVFRNKLERQGVRVYTHRFTKGYPTDVDLIVGDEGYGANEYVETEHPLVIITGPGPGSGKLATCLSELYHDFRRGQPSGYAKLETFPIWDLPLKHPVNMAYEAATADIGDFNLVDPFHLESYGKTAVNYNRDVEVFPVLRRILERITGERSMYQSPTDMGVNVCGSCITDDAAVRAASLQELIRRFLRYQCEYVLGFTEKKTVQRAELLMNEAGLKPEDRRVVGPARRAAEDAADTPGKGNDGVFVGAAIELPDGSIVTGRNSPLMHAASALIINAMKKMAGIPDMIPLLSPSVIESVANLKKDRLKARSVSLNLSETMICLAIVASSNPTADMALEKLRYLSGCEVHMTHIPSPGDESGLKKLGLNLTSDPVFPTKNLFFR